jgi:hypothetical protein
MFGRKKKKQETAINEPVQLPLDNTTAATSYASTAVSYTAGMLPNTNGNSVYYTTTDGSTYTAVSASGSGTYLMANNAGTGLTWVNPRMAGSNWVGSTSGGTYGPTTVTWTDVSHGILNVLNLNTFSNFKLDFIGVGYFSNSAVSSDSIIKPLDYSLSHKNYICFVEQDFTDLALSVNTVSMLQNNKKRYGILAYDIKLNRLELTSVMPEEETIANLENLLDDQMNIKQDKTEFLSSLYGRRIPFVNCTVTSLSSSYYQPPVVSSADFPEKSANFSLELEHSEEIGLMPFVHLSNLVFNNLLPPTKAEVAECLKQLNAEVLLTNKSQLPAVQSTFSPEYGYLTLKHPAVVKKHLREPIDYTKEGLEELLTKICVEASNPKPFVQELLNSMSLDQRILNIEDRAVVVIKSLIEQNID